MSNNIKKIHSHFLEEQSKYLNDLYKSQKNLKFNNILETDLNNLDLIFNDIIITKKNKTNSKNNIKLNIKEHKNLSSRKNKNLF